LLRQDQHVREVAAAESAAEVQVRFAADPASVPGARRFVTDGLTSWGLVELVEDATLCVSELAANAALHSGSGFMQIGMRRLDGVVRISVEDEGVVPAQAVVPRPSFPDPDDDSDTLRLEDEPTTGRGLAIVSVLASEWGVDETAAGKRVWVDVTHTDIRHGVRQPRTSTSGSPGQQPGGPLPAGWVLVRLLGCPVRLSLRQDEHLDELIRELQLIDGDQDRPRSRDLASQLRGLLSGPAHARHTGRRVAQQAAAAGKDYIDVEMAMPREFSAEVQKLQTAVKAADVLCEDLRLLTLSSSADVRALRAWMTEELVAQIERGASPVSWQHWLSLHA
jgi:anti-sigma regulatory factor (Ser/Thr protein kinase)